MTSIPELSPDQGKLERIEIEFQSAELAIVSLLGEHDFAGCARLQNALDTAAARRRSMIVDLTPCTFIDSTTVSLLLHAQGEVVSGGGRFALVCPKEPGSPVARTAELLNFAQLFPTFASLEEALTETSHEARVRDLRASYAPRGGDLHAAG